MSESPLETLDDSGHSDECMIQWCPSRDSVVRRRADNVRTAPERLTTLAVAITETLDTVTQLWGVAGKQEHVKKS